MKIVTVIAAIAAALALLAGCGEEAKPDIVDVAVQLRVGFDQPQRQQAFVYRAAKPRLALDVDRRILSQAR